MTGRGFHRGAIRLATALALALALVLSIPADAHARVVRVTIESRELLGRAASFGMTGAYERITGRIHFAFDPGNPQNRHPALPAFSNCFP